MEIKQKNQKLPFLILQLTLSALLLAEGFLSSGILLTSEEDRRFARFAGVAALFISIIWYFFGSIDWSDVNRIKRQLKRMSQSSKPTDAVPPEQEPPPHE